MILASENDVYKTNEQILSTFVAQQDIYLSINTVVDSDHATDFPIKFLNSLNPPEIPPHNGIL